MNQTRSGIRKKLLVATVGVAAVSYVACETDLTSGNLVAPRSDASVREAASPEDANADRFISSGNLVAPDSSDGATDATTDADGMDASGDAAGD